jgi:hypothetical protein
MGAKLNRQYRSNAGIWLYLGQKFAATFGIDVRSGV